MIPRRRPTTDWVCTAVLDAKAGDEPEEARCEVCGTKLRWVHVLEHPAYHRPIDVGCCCAVRLCDNYDARSAERDVRNRLDRRWRFLDPGRWRRSRAGNRVRKVSRWLLTIFEQGGRWRFSAKKKGDAVVFSRVSFRTEEVAMVGAFDWIEREGDDRRLKGEQGGGEGITPTNAPKIRLGKLRTICHPTPVSGVVASCKKRRKPLEK